MHRLDSNLSHRSPAAYETALAAFGTVVHVQHRALRLLRSRGSPPARHFRPEACGGPRDAHRQRPCASLATTRARPSPGCRNRPPRLRPERSSLGRVRRRVDPSADRVCCPHRPAWGGAAGARHGQRTVPRNRGLVSPAYGCATRVPAQGLPRTDVRRGARATSYEGALPGGRLDSRARAPLVWPPMWWLDRWVRSCASYPKAVVGGLPDPRPGFLGP